MTDNTPKALTAEDVAKLAKGIEVRKKAGKEFKLFKITAKDIQSFRETKDGISFVTVDGQKHLVDAK